MPDPDLFQRWKEVEEVAMHFNGLILDFRTKAIGAVSLVASGLGALALRRPAEALNEAGEKASNKKHAENLKVVGYVLLFLVAMWCAAFLLDNFYYHELLLGAVDEAKRLEGNAALGITMSTVIEKRRAFEIFWSGWQRHFFYLIPHLAMVFGFYKCRRHALFESKAEAKPLWYKQWRWNVEGAGAFALVVPIWLAAYGICRVDRWETTVFWWCTVVLAVLAVLLVCVLACRRKKD